MKKSLLGLFFLSSLLHGCTQEKNYNQWTIISLGGTEALVFGSELKVKEQVRYINVDDEVNIERIRHKIEGKKEPLWLIIKAADSTISISPSYQAELRKALGPVEKLTVEPLNEKEKEMLALFKKEYPNGQEKDPVKKLDLKMPKEEPEEHRIQVEKKCVTVLLLAGDDWWCYQDTSISSGTLYNIKEFQHFISEKKKEFGDSILVVIKPTAQATYKATVDVLDQMTINQIKRYAMVKLHEKEERFLSAKGLIELQAPVKIKNPTTVTTQEIPNDNAFIIEIRKDHSVWYQIISPLNKMALQKVNTPITKNLKNIIADYERSSPGIKKTYLIKGDGEAKYPDLVQVLDALKENNIYKYNLVTAEN